MGDYHIKSAQIINEGKISFVDILIQAVFLLLLILMVGYIDPVPPVDFVN